MLQKIDRIIILTNTLKNGGAEKQSIMLAKSLMEEYRTIMIVYYGEQVDARLLNLVSEYKIDVLYLKGSHIRKLVNLSIIFLKQKNSAIFSYLATTNLINGVLGTLTRVRVLIGGIRTDSIKGLKFYIQRFLHNYLLDRSVFNNHHGLYVLSEKGFLKSKSLVIHNCMEMTLGKRHKKNVDLNTLNILTIGRFVREKDYFTAIDALKLTQDSIERDKQKIDIKYTIIGYGILESKIREYIKINGLEKIINIIINPNSTLEYLKNADIYLSTSVKEGLSNSILEAMEAGLPIICTNVGDNCYLVKDKYNGYIVEVMAAKNISKKILSFVENPILLSKMGMHSYVLVESKFSAEIFKKKYLNLLNGFEYKN